MSRCFVSLLNAICGVRIEAITDAIVIILAMHDSSEQGKVDSVAIDVAV